MSILVLAKTLIKIIKKYNLNYSEVTVTTKEENVEILQALFGQYNFDSFVETKIGFDAYIESSLLDKGVNQELSNLQAQFEFTFKSKEVENKNWNEEWEKNFHPIIIEKKCLIRADFHSQNTEVEHEIIITPKMSFGTGHHATTYQMVNKLFDLNIKNKSVLDMGCGTGVLAILAKKLGSAYTVGIDIDEWSVTNSIENIERNDTQDIEIKQGDANLLGNYQKFDVILANINRNILLNDMKHYASVLQEGGDILFSGFYTVDIPLIVEEAKKNNFTLIDQSERDNWSLLHFQA